MKKILILVFTLLILMSCDFSMYLDEGLDFDESSFNINRQLWEEKGETDYEFTQSHFSLSTGPMPEIRVLVSNNQFSSHEIVSNSSNIDENSIVYFKTIDEVYDYIYDIAASCRESIESGHEASMYGAKIEVQYNEVYNIPQKVSCVGYYRDGVVGGLSSDLTISGFKASK